MNESPVQKAAHAVASHLEELGIDYAIEARSLPSTLREELNPYVREKFDELWHSVQHEPDDIWAGLADAEAFD